MQLTLDNFLERYNCFFDSLFFSDEFERYIHFFDRLISVNEIPIGCYVETDTFIPQLAKLIEKPTDAINFFCSKDCDYMFDFYYRYHILVEYFIAIESVQVKSLDKIACFEELFLKTWSLGVSNFSHKNF